MDGPEAWALPRTLGYVRGRSVVALASEDGRFIAFPLTCVRKLPLSVRAGHMMLMRPRPRLSTQAFFVKDYMVNHPEDGEKIGRLRELMFEQVGAAGTRPLLPEADWLFRVGAHPGVRPGRAREGGPPGHETAPQEAGGPVSSDEVQPGHPGESLSPPGQEGVFNHVPPAPPGVSGLRARQSSALHQREPADVPELCAEHHQPGRRARGDEAEVSLFPSTFLFSALSVWVVLGSAVASALWPSAPGLSAPGRLGCAMCSLTPPLCLLPAPQRHGRRTGSAPPPIFTYPVLIHLLWILNQTCSNCFLSFSLIPAGPCAAIASIIF